MRTSRMLATLTACAATLVLCAASLCAQTDRKPLPAPQMTGGKPVMDALKARRTDRAFAVRKLSDQTLANLLWAADGVNREDGKRTAPSAMNWQEIDVYATTADGVYMYDAGRKDLVIVSSEDVRALTGRQPFVKDAPVNLVYVADYARIKRGSDEDKLRFSYADCGFISQNVYLFCASEGLNTVVRGMPTKDETLSKALKLRPEQKVLLSQTIGYPPE